MRSNEMIKVMMRKLASVMVLFIMVLAFASCGGNESDITETSETVPVETQEALPEEGPDVNESTADGPAVETEDIGYDKVKEIVLDRVPGASESDIYELEKEFDGGILEYEGSVYYGGYEYEFEINGKTGDILQWEIDD